LANPELLEFGNPGLNPGLLEWPAGYSSPIATPAGSWEALSLQLRGPPFIPGQRARRRPQRNLFQLRDLQQ